MRLRKMSVGAAVGAAALIGSLAVSPTMATANSGVAAAADTSVAAVSGRSKEYVVLITSGAEKAAAVAAVEKAGGRVVGGNAAIGTLKVVAPERGFITAVSASPAVDGAASNRRIGYTPRAQLRKSLPTDVEREARSALGQGNAKAQGMAKGEANGEAKGTRHRPGVGLDPLDRYLWGLRMVRSDLARMVQPGRRQVKVGVLDSGIDARNPDLARNFDRRLSRNFVVDMPEIDGPCEFRGCVDPADWDDSGHGTHVAGTIGARVNDFGVSGVAPKVTLVNIRGGQDSGYLFLGPVTDALTYGADVGLDVINMSFYVDPWLYNCYNNPADSPEAQAEQRTIIRTMRRALNYAHNHNVTLVGALGNNHEDLGKPRTDVSSPDFPPGQEYERPIDNATCFDLPVEGPHVIGVSALGPSSRKADYSNYGLERIEVSAPGGWYRDYFGTDQYRTNENLILSTYPVNALQDEGLVDEDGNITEDGETLGVMKQCRAGETDYTRCGYYNWLQGTSMASPHATGVAALIVSEYGHRTRRGGFTLDPDRTRSILLASAQERACPEPRTVDYLKEGRTPEWTATCEGTRNFNGFYGYGIVDAYRAVTLRRFR